MRREWAMRLLMAFLISHFSFLISAAQTLTGRAPSQVAVGEQFRLTYTVNTDDVKGFRAGEIPEGLEVLMGPSSSTQSSWQMANGHVTSSSSVTYTYIVVAQKQGTFTIPPATVQAGGKTVHSNELRIKAEGQAQQQGRGQRSQQSGAGTEIRPAGIKRRSGSVYSKVTKSRHPEQKE